MHLKCGIKISMMWEVANRKISVLYMYKLVPQYSSMKLTTSDKFRPFLIEKNDSGGGVMERYVGQSD